MQIIQNAWGIVGGSAEQEERLAYYAAGIGDDYACAVRDAMTQDARAHGLGFVAELIRIHAGNHEGA